MTNETPSSTDDGTRRPPERILLITAVPDEELTSLRNAVELTLAVLEEASRRGAKLEPFGLRDGPASWSLAIPLGGDSGPLREFVIYLDIDAPDFAAVTVRDEMPTEAAVGAPLLALAGPPQPGILRPSGKTPAEIATLLATWLALLSKPKICPSDPANEFDAAVSAIEALGVAAQARGVACPVEVVLSWGPRPHEVRDALGAPLPLDLDSQLDASLPGYVTLVARDDSFARMHLLSPMAVRSTRD